MSSCDNNCQKVSGRINGQCPVYNMADGRHFTDYSPRCVLNNSIVNSTNGLMNSYDYRRYLQQNAEKIMEDLQKERYEQTVCVPCYDYNEAGTMLPEKNKFNCNEYSCELQDNSTDGIGTGRDYNIKTRNPMLNPDKASGVKVVKDEGGFFGFLGWK